VTVSPVASTSGSLPLPAAPSGDNLPAREPSSAATALTFEPAVPPLPPRTPTADRPTPLSPLAQSQPTGGLLTPTALLQQVSSLAAGMQAALTTPILTCLHHLWWTSSVHFQ